MILNSFIVLTLYGVIFAASEIAYRHGIPSAYSRKIAHIGAGIVSALLPFFFDLIPTLALGTAFTVLLVWTSRHHLLDGIHNTEERSHGAVLFPVGLMFSAVMFWGVDPFLFQVSALVQGLSDALAGIGGNLYGRKSYSITGKKTYIGSVLFFVVTFIIMLIASLNFRNYETLINIGIIALSSLILTVVEGLFGKGWDNLIIPPASGFLLYCIFSTG